MNRHFKLFIWLMVLAVGCKRETCFGEAGAFVSISRDATAFHEIAVYDNINVVLIQDSLEHITVLAPQHLEPNITTQIENGILSIRNEGTCTGLRNTSEKATVQVGVKKLDRIVYAGSGNISSTNTLLADNLTIYSEEGAGNIDISLNAVQTFSYIMDENADITLHGASDFCYSYTASRGSIDFSDFVVKKMALEYGGVRDATIQVTEELNSIIYYKGNVFYKGTPLITNNKVHSSGRLIRYF